MKDAMRKNGRAGVLLQLMREAATIFNLVAERPEMHGMLAFEANRQNPGSVHYTIKRFVRPEDWMSEDTGMLKYHFNASEPEKNHLELRFCITGQMYCRQYGKNCTECKAHATVNCNEKSGSIDMLSFVFSSTHLSQFVKSRISSDNIADRLLSFTHTTSFSKVLPICNKTRMVLESLLNHSYTDTQENIFVNAQTQMLLLYGLDYMLGEKEIDTITCKFLANETDRDKLIRAREILIQQIGEPITIKELSRKVAMNECYLKKGFKEMFGTTIFDFYQSQRMEHAKYLLYEKGLSVTEVALMLGYSSISHFSTAFKKHTGLKPCELLFR
ncbi:AraC family transcriptional regulator [Paraflavisolibacter sp. H34]|uniref:AraC family transcriptional regulator n=1 Tax=Huijunlia imazamoxiresistens TaxID=3127457 RepID=UPI003017EA1F